MKQLKWLPIAFACGLWCVAAQAPSRDDYRNAYRDWRQADPNLERDVATAIPDVESRAAKEAEQVSKFGAARQAFLRALQGQMAQRIADLESGAAPEDVPASVAKTVDDYLAQQGATLNRSIDAFANDPDRGIQQLRQALERERAALNAITPAIADRRKAAEATTQTAESAQQALLKALDQYQELSVALKQTIEQTDAETSSWADYYKQLTAGPGSVTTQTARPPNTARPSNTAATSNLGASPTTVGTAAPAAPRVQVSDPAVRTSSITPVPLARYTGTWGFPISNGLFHGAQPDFVDLAVHEENGHASGTLFARFKLPPGSTGDPEVRFDFTGDFASSRIQRFNLETSDRATGVIELIPGPAFNLLEVNFQTNAPAGKVRQANFVLLKK